MAVFYESYYGVSSLGVNNCLMHHGIKGQRWGIRRFQNPDGSLTNAGKQRYDTDGEKKERKGLSDKQKKALKGIAIGAGVAAGVGLAAYAGHKSGIGKDLLYSHINTKDSFGPDDPHYKLKLKALDYQKQKRERQLWNESKKAYNNSKLFDFSGTKSKASNALDTLKNMTDDELVTKVGRLEKEKRLIDLDREISNFGKSAARRVLSRAGSTAISTVTAAAALYGSKKAIKGTLNRLGIDGEKVVREMFPKKK